ncbi:hypothetical protein ABKN59_002175 [Abortiporus biennis]
MNEQWYSMGPSPHSVSTNQPLPPPTPRLRVVPLPEAEDLPHSLALEAHTRFAASPAASTSQSTALALFIPVYSATAVLSHGSYVTGHIPLWWSLSRSPREFTVQWLDESILCSHAVSPKIKEITLSYPLNIRSEIRIKAGEVYCGTEFLTVADILYHIHQHLRTPISRDASRLLDFTDKAIYNEIVKSANVRACGGGGCVRWVDLLCRKSACKELYFAGISQCRDIPGRWCFHVRPQLHGMRTN